MVDVGDDLIIAGVGAALSGAAAIFGARIGARSTRDTALYAFNLAAEREDENWREALRRECELNLTRWGDLDPSDLHWSFDALVLSESLLHARAFTDDEFQRIIWVRKHNDKVEQTLAPARDRRVGPSGQLPELRERVHGEIQALFNTLNAHAKSTTPKGTRRRFHRRQRLP